MGHGKARAYGFPIPWVVFDPRLCRVRFVVDKMALGQVFSEYFSLPFQFSFYWLLHIH
jgi:hypothetical protein